MWVLTQAAGADAQARCELPGLRPIAAAAGPAGVGELHLSLSRTVSVTLQQAPALVAREPALHACVLIRPHA